MTGYAGSRDPALIYIFNIFFLTARGSMDDSSLFRQRTRKSLVFGYGFLPYIIWPFFFLNQSYPGRGAGELGGQSIRKLLLKTIFQIFEKTIVEAMGNGRPMADTGLFQRVGQKNYSGGNGQWAANGGYRIIPEGRANKSCWVKFSAPPPSGIICVFVNSRTKRDKIFCSPIEKILWGPEPNFFFI